MPLLSCDAMQLIIFGWTILECHKTMKSLNWKHWEMTVVYVPLYSLTHPLTHTLSHFHQVCPERIDLIHKNYRKLCNLLVDVEEWGQVIIINMLTRYARTQFINPNAGVSTLFIFCY